jgi:hypothetical protein
MVSFLKGRTNDQHYKVSKYELPVASDAEGSKEDERRKEGRKEEGRN